jgi:hypothetical protein
MSSHACRWSDRGLRPTSLALCLDEDLAYHIRVFRVMGKITSLGTSCLNGLDPIGIPGEGVAGRRLISRPAVATGGVLCLYGGALTPGQGLRAVPPAPRTGVECWAIGRPAPQAPVRREAQALGGLGPTVSDEPDRETRGERGGPRVHATRPPLRRQRGPFPEASVAGEGRHGAGDGAPRADGGPGAAGLDALGGEAPAAAGQAAAPAVVWAEPPAGTPRVRRAGRLAVVGTGGLAGRQGRRGVWWAAAGPPCAWSGRVGARWSRASGPCPPRRGAGAAMGAGPQRRRSLRAGGGPAPRGRALPARARPVGLRGRRSPARPEDPGRRPGPASGRSSGGGRPAGGPPAGGRGPAHAPAGRAAAGAVAAGGQVHAATGA